MRLRPAVAQLPGRPGPEPPRPPRAAMSLLQSALDFLAGPGALGGAAGRDQTDFVGQTVELGELRLRVRRVLAEGEARTGGRTGGRAPRVSAWRAARGGREGPGLFRRGGRSRPGHFLVGGGPGWGRAAPAAGAADLREAGCGVRGAVAWGGGRASGELG